MAAPTTPATSQWTGPRPFVGREQSLDRLDRALERLRSGSGCSIFVVGARGSGKHRLVGRFLDRVAAADPPVGIIELAAGQPRDVWKTLRARLTRGRRIRRFLSAVLPEWIDFVPVIGPVTTALIRSVQTLRRKPGSAEPGTRTAARRRTGAVAALDDTLAEIRTPLVVVLREFERAGDDELAGAFHAIRMLPANPVLLVATITPDHGRNEAPVLDLVREAERYDTDAVIRLDPLLPAQWAAAVEQATRQPLPPAWRRWLARHEPLFPDALWTLLGRAEHELGALASAPDGWHWVAEPPPVDGRTAPSDTAASRTPATGGGRPPVDAALDGLDPDDRILLARATTDGGTFDTRTARGDSDLDELEVQDRLARLERSGWIRFVETHGEDDDLHDVYTVTRPGLVEALRAWWDEAGSPPP